MADNPHKVRFTSPVGRLVQGDPWTPQTKDMQGNPLVVKTGANAGQPTQRYNVSLAVPKLDAQGQPNAELAAFYGQILAVSVAGFPHLFPQGAAGPCVRPDFAFKVIDGDSPVPDQKGKPWNTKEGFPGHWVFKFGSAYAPKCFAAGHYAANEQLTDPQSIKRGHYIRVNGSIEPNGDVAKPGVYLNLDLVEWAGFGPEISSGPDAAAAFGAGPGALPVGASALPVMAPGGPAAGGVAMPGPGGPAPAPAYPGGPVAMPPGGVPGGPVMPPAAAYPAGPGGPGMAPAPVAPAPGAPAAPYAGYMAPAAPGAPAAPAAAAPAPYNPQDYMTATATTTYAAYREAQWTDAQLIAHGFMRDHVPY
jgi:hypothetical protein